MIQVTPTLALDERELQWEFTRASGPGGQRVNKVSTAVQLRFDVANTAVLPEDIRERLMNLGGKRITSEGILIIEARRFRTQEKNRQDALDRLIKLIRTAAEKPKKRRRTKPTKASEKRRLEEKRRRAETKRRRQPPSIEE
ncbi:MAG: alternative ribosome rescue aminoacyl-tRNA hydrolase ArfB [Anaerolineales bacterium]|jgi:ribosome-associated protein